MKRSKVLVGMLLFFACLFMSGSSVFADGAEEFKTALVDGNFSGEIGSYVEYTDKEASDSNSGWATAYLTFKYETLEWNNVQFGVRFFGHGQIYNETQNSSDPFGSDVETEFTLPEIYFNYGFGEASNFRVGHWEHGEISHIDDSHSEGLYVQYKEIKNFEFVAGLMKRFAEIDYDDGEDFGRANDAQDLDDETTYGSDSKPTLYFVEGKTAIGEHIKFNPFIMYQDGYASVYGIDTDLIYKIEDINATIGADVNYYYVQADIDGSTNSQNWEVAPYIKKGPITAIAGYAQFDDGDSLNKPAWFADYFVPIDQQSSYGQAGASVYYAKVKYSKDKFWAHIAAAEYDHDLSASKGDRTLEKELQFGYKFTKSFDVNLRLFDVRFYKVDDKDYKKVEARIRFKF